MYLNVSHVSRWWSLGGFPNTATLETSWRCHCTQQHWPLGRGGQTCCHLETDETVNDSMMPRMVVSSLVAQFSHGDGFWSKHWRQRMKWVPVSSPKLCQVPSLSRYALFILNVESIIRNHKSKSICFGFAGVFAAERHRVFSVRSWWLSLGVGLGKVLCLQMVSWGRISSCSSWQATADSTSLAGCKYCVAAQSRWNSQNFTEPLDVNCLIRWFDRGGPLFLGPLVPTMSGTLIEPMLLVISHWDCSRWCLGLRQ